MSGQRIIVFASGTAQGGGSGFRNLVEAARAGRMGAAEIAGVVSNHINGGVRTAAAQLRVPFVFHPGPFVAADYAALRDMVLAEWAVLSGWLKPVTGLDPRRTINIHPAPLPRFGGKGMYGLHAHRAVIAAYQRGEITESEVTMHFVTDKYDDGPVFFRYPVTLFPDDSAESLQKRAQHVEHAWQPLLTRMVVSGDISWDGRDPASLVLPPGYRFV